VQLLSGLYSIGEKSSHMNFFWIGNVLFLICYFQCFSLFLVTMCVAWDFLNLFYLRLIQLLESISSVISKFENSSALRLLFSGFSVMLDVVLSSHKSLRLY
jgi:hypothetical protein